MLLEFSSDIAALEILDLSEAGAQPMVSRSGQLVLVFNGEIYNFRELRQQLEAEVGGEWRGTSDTEALLLAIQTWGIETTLARLEGMFAFAVWDRGRRELLLARDRFGEKPLYIAKTNEGMAFASQLKGILQYPGFQGIENEDAIDFLLALTYIPEPLTPFTNVWKLPPGCFTRLVQGDQSFTPVRYWDPSEAAIVARKEAQRQRASQEELEFQIEERLTKVISNQMIADVPVGAFCLAGSILASRLPYAEGLFSSGPKLYHRL